MQLGVGGVVKRVVKMVSFLLYGQPFLRYRPFLKSAHLADIFEKCTSCGHFRKCTHLAYFFKNVHILRTFSKSAHLADIFEKCTSCGHFRKVHVLRTFSKMYTSCGLFQKCTHLADFFENVVILRTDLDFFTKSHLHIVVLIYSFSNVPFGQGYTPIWCS